jgi:hypothetical protein
VQVAAWLKIGRNSGTEYLSLKVGNNDPEDPETYTVGPFYGRLFRQVEGSRTRYFGFIEEAEKTGEDEKRAVDLRHSLAIARQCQISGQQRSEDQVHQRQRRAVADERAGRRGYQSAVLIDAGRPGIRWVSVFPFLDSRSTFVARGFYSNSIR